MGNGSNDARPDFIKAPPTVRCPARESTDEIPPNPGQRDKDNSNVGAQKRGSTAHKPPMTHSTIRVYVTDVKGVHLKREAILTLTKLPITANNRARTKTRT